MPVNLENTLQNLDNAIKELNWAHHALRHFQEKRTNDYRKEAIEKIVSTMTICLGVMRDIGSVAPMMRDPQPGGGWIPDNRE